MIPEVTVDFINRERFAKINVSTDRRATHAALLHHQPFSNVSVFVFVAGKRDRDSTKCLPATRRNMGIDCSIRQQCSLAK